MKNVLFKSTITLLLYLSTSSVLFSQSKNLVNNYSFETFIKCPEDYTPQDQSHKFVPGWTYPTYATPDYFNRCSPKRELGVSVPENFAGVSEPHSGDGYAGLILSGTDDGYREYIQGSLTEPLIAGKEYCVTYFFRLASYSKFSVDQLSLCFTNEEIKSSIVNNLSLQPQINNKEGFFLDNTDEWQSKCIVFKASGGERFFTIGNFNSYNNTNYVATDKDMKNLRDKSYAYYYIDDVIIKALDNCTDCDCVQHDFEAQIIDSSYSGGFNEFTGMVDGKENDGHIKIATAGGTPPYRVDWTNGMKGAELSNLPHGIYQYTAMDRYNCQAKGKIVFKKPAITVDKFENGFENIQEGESIILKNIFFEYGKTTLLPASFIELDKVVAFIQKNNISLIEISGHTDSDGSETFNQKLSEGRAQSVVEYIASKNIAQNRMKAVGYGEAKPIETNLTKAGQAVNRRVEFTLLKK